MCEEVFLKAQTLIRNEISYRMGSGKNISIVNDPWLPDAQNPYIVTDNTALEGQKVSTLLETGKNRWDVDLLRDMFEKRDINLILSIPLGRNEQDVWY